MWTSVAKRGYMVATLHYINRELKTRSVIISFVRVMYPHTGARLGDHLIEDVKAMDPDLLSAIWIITTENAPNNDTMCQRINDRLESVVEAITSDFFLMK